MILTFSCSHFVKESERDIKYCSLFIIVSAFHMIMHISVITFSFVVLAFAIWEKEVVAAFKKTTTINSSKVR